MNHRTSRRRFLRDSAGVGMSLALAGALRGQDARPGPSERLNLGVIGLSGRGAANLDAVKDENIVALCDVDTSRADKARQQFPQASFYQDFRRLLDRKDIDAVVISTPDHMHAIPAVQAMRAGKHLYCEKPLAHSVHEIRTMMAEAEKHHVVTQMGTQMHAEENYRRAVEIVQAGVIGAVDRVHVWCEKRPKPVHKAKPPQAAPASLDYDLWLGPAPFRPYDRAHCHFSWRWWWDFGGGILTDMGCHYVDLPFWALGLSAPTTVNATFHKGPEGDQDAPDVITVDYSFAARGPNPAVHLTWYSGLTGPDPAGKVTYGDFKSGILLVGSKGNLLVDQHRLKLLPEEQFKDFIPPPRTIAPSIGHQKEWLAAIRTGGKPSCHFAYGGVLAEAVLLGNVSLRSGQPIAWDAKAGRITNTRSADQYLQTEYRDGWSL